MKLILPIASTIGRASKLVMSICSTVRDSSSALRVSLIWLSSWILMSVSVVIHISNDSSSREGGRASARTGKLGTPAFAEEPDVGM